MQQIVIYNTNRKLCLIIAAVEAEHEFDDALPPQPIENCQLPRIIPRPNADVGWVPQMREQ